MVTQRDASLYNMRSKRKEAANKSQFKNLVNSPHSLGSVARNNDLPSPVELPSSGVIGVSFSQNVSQGQLLVKSSTGRTLGTQDVSSGFVSRIGYFEKGVTLTSLCSIAGTVSLHYLDDQRNSEVVATGTFT